ncbi:MAG TPA: pyridoxal phosphate-dependent aminotransferase [Candidatus Acidoferrum sp.]|nr:pyridoxal phosphate-dependent aminotransferase [Candidatus Acidoferrum sp.]
MLADRTSRFSISGIRDMFGLTRPDSINLGLGQPDFDTPKHIKEAAKDAIDEGFCSYTPNKGYPELLDAISDYYRRYGLDASQENIIVTAGGSEGLHLAFEVLINPGDQVIVPDPGFVAYSSLAYLAGGTPVSARLKPENDFVLLSEDVADLITNKTKALVLNSPSNPTGSVQPRDEIRAIVELAQDYNFYIISDEVYDRILYEGEHVSPASIDPERVIVINALSKTFAMTGWRLGYTIAPHNATEEMLKVHQYIQACASSVSQKAAFAALVGSQDFVNSMVSEFRQRKNLVLKRLKGVAECVSPKGAFYVFPYIAAYGHSRDVAMKLAKNGVIVVAGQAFGQYGEGYIRISYAADRKKIDRAFDIIERVLNLD